MILHTEENGENENKYKKKRDAYSASPDFKYKSMK